MTSKKANPGARKAALLMTTIMVVAMIVPSAAPQSKQSAPQPTGKGFDTPEQASQALLKAAEPYDVPALLEILGPDGKDLVTSEDPVTDKNNATAFAARVRE